ncbi:hypothetical protein pb186bvf_007264 [Paramecium bursaria]
MDTNTTIKLLVVGDGAVGKTCVLLSYAQDKFPTDYVPTVFENYTSQVQYDGKTINLSLWDTAGQETYNQVRQLSYDGTDVFLIIFSVIDPNSFENAVRKWLPELSQNTLALVPKIFVGNKIDMRSDGNPAHIMQSSASQVIKAQGPFLYQEVSALTQTGLKELFTQAIKLGHENWERKNRPADAIKKQKIQEQKCCNIQ